jgi:hypothetical protein
VDLKAGGIAFSVAKPDCVGRDRLVRTPNATPRCAAAIMVETRCGHAFHVLTGALDGSRPTAWRLQASPA